jgi:hypothetical protein
MSPPVTAGATREARKPRKIDIVIKPSKRFFAQENAVQNGGNAQAAQEGRHDWFYYTSTKCAIPDDMAGQQRFWGALVTSAQH